jgi:hypothetical protein
MNPPIIPANILECLSIGGTAWNSHDFVKAKQFANDALELALQQKCVQGELGSLHLLANIAFNECEDKLSREMHERILAISLEIGFLDGAASSLANLALIYIVEGDLETARDKYLQAVSLYEKSGSIEMANTIRVILSKEKLETVLEGVIRIS